MIEILGCEASDAEITVEGVEDKSFPIEG